MAVQTACAECPLPVVMGDVRPSPEPFVLLSVWDCMGRGQKGPYNGPMRQKDMGRGQSQLKLVRKCVFINAKFIMQSSYSQTF